MVKVQNVIYGISVIEVVIVVIGFILTFIVNPGDLRDPIWLVPSVVVVVILAINLSLQMYAIFAKNTCIVVASGVARVVITGANVAVIVVVIVIQFKVYVLPHVLGLGFPYLVYNFLLTILLFRLARKQQQLEHEECTLHHHHHHQKHPHYARQISIPRPNFQADVDGIMGEFGIQNDPQNYYVPRYPDHVHQQHFAPHYILPPPVMRY